MELLEKLLLAHGGLDRWRYVQRFTLYMSIGGELIHDKCGATTLKDIVVQGSTQEQFLEIIGFTASDLIARYQPDSVVLEGRDNGCISEQRLSHAEFRGRLLATTWDELLLAYFCGSAIWNYIALPFCLADSDVHTEELAPIRVRAETWGRLKARFPQRLATYSTEQMFYINGGSLLRRHDYASPCDSHTRIAQEFWGHQRFSGILVPTLSRQLAVEADGAVIARPALVDIEVFDAIFE